MPHIKAAVCYAFGAPLTFEDVDLRAPIAGEVEVTLAACAICHSDIHAAEGAWGGALPAVFGHEAAGRITATGAGVTRYAQGDHVVVTLLRNCGGCGACASGKGVFCETAYDRSQGPLTTVDGGTLVHGLSCGAFAEKVVVDQSQIAHIPADMPMDAAALLACGVVTGVGAAVNTAAVRPGEVVVVIGAGGVGLNAIQGARLAGAARVIAVDMNAEKLIDARAFGATDGVLATDASPWNAAQEIAGRAADVVIVTVGALPAFDSAPNYLGNGGRMVMVGMPHSGEMAQYEPVMVTATGQTLKGSPMGDTVLARDIPWMIDLYRQERLKLDELISGRWRLDQINEAFADTKSGSARRNVIMF